jgi:hypothetical protein
VRAHDAGIVCTLVVEALNVHNLVFLRTQQKETQKNNSNDSHRHNRSQSQRHDQSSTETVKKYMCDTPAGAALVTNVPRQAHTFDAHSGSSTTWHTKPAASSSSVLMSGMCFRIMSGAVSHSERTNSSAAARTLSTQHSTTL